VKLYVLEAVNSRRSSQITASHGSEHRILRLAVVRKAAARQAGADGSAAEAQVVAEDAGHAFVHVCQEVLATIANDYTAMECEKGG